MTMSEQVWADRRILTCGTHQDETFVDECLYCKIEQLEARLKSSQQDAAFYKCCALSGETPKDGAEPSAAGKADV
jgi:hypothetical protein